MSEPTPPDPTAVPAAGTPAPTPPASPPSAPLLRRFAALFYESLLLGAVLLLAGFLFALAVTPLPGAAGSKSLQIPSLAERAIWFVALFAVGALYFGWCWTGGRRTLPMKTWRMRLARADGCAVDVWTAMLRYFAAWIGPALAVVAYAALAPTGHPRLALWLLLFNYAWAFVDRGRRFLHDRIADTCIVDDRPRGSRPEAGSA